MENMYTRLNENRSEFVVNCYKLYHLGNKRKVTFEFLTALLQEFLKGRMLVMKNKNRKFTIILLENVNKQTGHQQTLRNEHYQRFLCITIP